MNEERQQGQQSGILRQLSSSASSELVAAAHALRNAQCCASCVLRLLGERCVDTLCRPDLEASLVALFGERRAAETSAAETSTTTFRAFVSTQDETLFTGAKLVSVPARTTSDLLVGVCKSLCIRPDGLKLLRDGKLLTDCMLPELKGPLKLEIARGGELAATEEVVTPAVETRTNTSTAAPFVCSICIGTAQRLQEWVAIAKAQILAAGFVLDPSQGIKVGVGMPSDCLIRQRLVQIHCRLLEVPTYDLKIVLQHALSPAIRKCLAGTTAGGRTFPGDGSAMDVQISWKYDGLQDAYDLSKACSKRSHNHPAKRQRGNNGSSNWKNNQVDTSWPCAIGCELETPLKRGQQTAAKLLPFPAVAARSMSKPAMVHSRHSKTIVVRRWTLQEVSAWALADTMAIRCPFAALAVADSTLMCSLLCGIIMFKCMSMLFSPTDPPGAKSVDELISASILPVFGHPEYKFSSGGREDKDVRMLGSGRPFTLELLNPKLTLGTGNAEDSSARLAQIEAHINDSCGDRVQVSGLGIVKKEYTDQIKAAEESKRKSYRCVCWIRQGGVTAEELKASVDEKSGGDAGLTIQQNTPIRVLHRRAPLIRPRQVFAMQTQWVNRKCFILDMQTSAGTYVKEFVHGDCGRTTPNIGTLIGKQTDILQLDVLNIDYA